MVILDSYVAVYQRVYLGISRALYLKIWLEKPQWSCWWIIIFKEFDGQFDGQFAAMAFSDTSMAMFFTHVGTTAIPSKWKKTHHPNHGYPDGTTMNFFWGLTTHQKQMSQFPMICGYLIDSWIFTLFEYCKVLFSDLC